MQLHKVGRSKIFIKKSLTVGLSPRGRLVLSPAVGSGLFPGRPIPSCLEHGVSWRCKTSGHPNAITVISHSVHSFSALRRQAHRQRSHSFCFLYSISQTSSEAYYRCADCFCTNRFKRRILPKRLYSIECKRRICFGYRFPAQQRLLCRAAILLIFNFPALYKMSLDTAKMRTTIFSTPLSVFKGCVFCTLKLTAAGRMAVTMAVSWQSFLQKNSQIMSKIQANDEVFLPAM